jgi:hypothetical protein
MVVLALLQVSRGGDAVITAHGDTHLAFITFGGVHLTADLQLHWYSSHSAVSTSLQIFNCTNDSQGSPMEKVTQPLIKQD